MRLFNFLGKVLTMIYIQIVMINNDLMYLKEIILSIVQLKIIFLENKSFY